MFNKVLILFFASIFQLTLLYSQNLVPNHSFEVYTQCPTTFSQAEYATGWLKANENVMPPHSTDYINVCGSYNFRVPLNYWGFQYAHTGSAYQAIAPIAPNLAVDYRENIYTQLNSPLIAGKKYKLAFFTNLGDFCNKATNNLGLKLSLTNSFPIDNTCQLYSNSVITDTAQWVMVSGYFIANNPYQFIAFGNFFHDANTTSYVYCNSCPLPYNAYFIDDIYVVKVPDVTITSNCNSTVVDFTISDSAYISSINWNFGDPSSGINNTAIGYSPSHNFSTFGNYNVNIYYTLDGLQDTINLIVSTSSVVTNINLGNDTSICYNSQLILSPGNNFNSYLWQDGSDSSFFTVTTAGIYSVTVTDMFGCIGMDSIIITQPNAPVIANGIANPTSGIYPLPVTFNFTGSGASFYTWDFGDFSGISTLQNPSHTYLQEGVFDVTLIAYTGSPYYCTDTFHILIDVETPPSQIFVPNVFTPNGDGKNDYFHVESQAIETFNCFIYNRWGNKIYEWSDINSPGWDGKTDDGKFACDGVYYYILRAKGFDKIEYNTHGTVTLLK